MNADENFNPAFEIRTKTAVSYGFRFPCGDDCESQLLQLPCNEESHPETFHLCSYGHVGKSQSICGHCFHIAASIQTPEGIV